MGPASIRTHTACYAHTAHFRTGRSTPSAGMPPSRRRDPVRTAVPAPQHASARLRPPPPGMCPRAVRECHAPESIAQVVLAELELAAGVDGLGRHLGADYLPAEQLPDLRWCGWRARGGRCWGCWRCAPERCGRWRRHFVIAPHAKSRVLVLQLRAHAPVSPGV